MVGILDPAKYGDYFYIFYTSNTRRKLQNDRKILAKRKNKDKKAAAVAAVAAVLEGNAGAIVNPIVDSPLLKDQWMLFPAFPVAHIELDANASKFAVYSAIRSTILEAETRYALFQDGDHNFRYNSPLTCCLVCVGTCLNSNLADCSCHTVMPLSLMDKRQRHESLNSDAESDADELTEKELSVVRVPLIVGAGLRSLFDLIAEARQMQPALCTKALKSLLDVIQGQQLESFKQEPEDLIEPLYNLLLDLATMPTAAASNETNWSGIACSALIGLSIARGDTGKTLKAIAALLMSPKILSRQLIKLPAVLSALQRTVICVALNKPSRPDFQTRGIPANSLVDEFHLKFSSVHNSSTYSQPALATDGVYLYLLLGSALYKIGTGFGGSYKGHIYAKNEEFTKETSCWLGFYGGQLYFRRNSKRTADHLHAVKMDTLTMKGISPLNLAPNREGSHFVLFTDDDSLNAICTNRDDSLVVKRLNTFQGSDAVFELPLQLARKKFRTLGYAAFEDEVLNQNQIQKIQSTFNSFEPKLPNEAEIQGIACGKEFGLVRASNGKVYYYGKPAALGLKAVGRTPNMKMTELIVSKATNITHVAIGHDGIHALLVNDDGTVYFAGTARRGEDGDSSKNRRQPKAVKPKKMTKIEGYVIVHAACNNGTSAFVTKSGNLIMYGKDTAHCDAMGFVIEFSEQHITKVALGKAHCVVLNAKGQLFTFGLNNKGQCGRILHKSRDTNTEAATLEKANTVNKKSKYDLTNVCDYDDHNVVQGQCRVCIMCRECTGYNVSCVLTMNVPLDDRVPGAICPCGHGDAGCSKCGLCSSCIRVQESDHDSKDAITKTLVNELCRQRSKTLIMRRKDKKYSEDCQATASSSVVATNASENLEKDPPRVAPLSPQMLTLPTSSPVVQIACGLHHTVVLTLAGEVFTFGSNQYGQLGTGELAVVMGTHKLQLTAGALVTQVAAGSNHTVLLTEKGMVYTFGNYQKGQLGRLPNDMQYRGNDEAKSAGKSAGEAKSHVSYAATHSSSNNSGSAAAAGSLREAAAMSNNLLLQRQKYLWHCSPGAVFGLGPSFGKRATWIGACGDQTFIKIDESLITPHMLPKVNVVANKKTILLIPTIPLTFNTLTISRRDGSCAAHYRNQVDFVQQIEQNKPQMMPEINQNAMPINEQMSRSMHEARNQIFEQEHHQVNVEQQRRLRKAELPSGSLAWEKPQSQLAFAMDSVYNVLWVYDGFMKKFCCYNVLASELGNGETVTNSNYFRTILCSELALPDKPQAFVPRSQAALNLLSCLDILTAAQNNMPGCFEEVAIKPQQQIKETVHDDYQIVNRFENFGGGWGYSGHSVEAIRFSSDADVMICGFAMFGGRGEYTCKLKLYDLGPEGGGYEKEGLLISETKEIPYDCAARSKHHIMLSKPVNAIAGRWYLVWARIAGPSSDCGSCGQASVTTEDQITFSFKSSKKANNGTDVNSGQIPAILYRLITHESKQPVSQDKDPVQRISKNFGNSVSRECFESLVALLSWSWDNFKNDLREQRLKARQLEVRQNLSFLCYVTKSCLRLLRKYTNEIYPHRAPTQAASKVAAPKPAKSASETKEKSSSKVGGVTGSVAGTPLARKPNMEEIQLAESIGNVRALLIAIFCDDILKDISTEEGYALTTEILDECHNSFVACFDAFYPTSTLKWNCLCDLLAQMDKGTLYARLLSAILAGLCSPAVKLRTTFSLINAGNERQSIISPSDNSGLPMLSSSEAHQYPILVEQMIYRTQQEKQEFMSNSWTFKDVLMRLLDIIANPVRAKIENMAIRNLQYNYVLPVRVKESEINQGLIENCCHLLARVLAEVVFQTSLGDFDKSFLPARALHCTPTRFARLDVCRTWNTGNFGPDAIAFSVDKPGLAIAGAMVYSGTGSYEYQLELLYDNTVDLQSQHKWETLESISGSYDQDVVQNDMAEIKFDRPVHIKENTRYALRLCSQGARTCSGDAGLPSVRGPCGAMFYFYSCDLSFNGTTPQRGQIPCILYYSSPVKEDGTAGAGVSAATGYQSIYGGNYIPGYGSAFGSETTSRDTALQISADITKKCTELLILARNTLAASLSPSDNSSNHTQTVDSEHNITPIEEHMDINWANNSRTAALPVEGNISTARDISKRIESFSKGIMETLKFDKKSTNPFEMEIEIGATEIHPKDLMEENASLLQMGKLNGNEGADEELIEEQPAFMLRSDSEDLPVEMSLSHMLDIFNMSSANIFHTLLPLVYAHIANLACCDPKSSVHILGLIKEILPHIAALNQLYNNKEPFNGSGRIRNAAAAAVINLKRADNESIKATPMERSLQATAQCTTSNHYCVVESEHPYRNASITSYRVDFPPCVQWLTVEFDPQCGTAQLEDYLLLSIPMRAKLNDKNYAKHDDYFDMLDNNISARQSLGSRATNSLNACYKVTEKELEDSEVLDKDWMVVKKFNTSGNWMQNVMILPGNCIEFSLETASLYAQDPHANRFGFKCLVVGYDNPTVQGLSNSVLMRLEQELAYLGGMCSANLMKRDLNLPDDKDIDDLSGVEETIVAHHGLLSKGLALSEPTLTVHQALESSLPIGSQSNERQFLKDFISGAPASAGARLAAWLQPESRLDPNKCELNAIFEPLRYGWPTPITVTIRDQYGDAVLVPDLKVEIKAIPTGASGSGNVKLRGSLYSEQASQNGTVLPRFGYEPTIRDKMCFKAITFMKPFNNYSFEELRYNSPIQTRITETLHAQDMEDGTFSVHWTPNSVGHYCLTVTIDGITLEEVYRVEVKEGGLPPPSQKLKKTQPPSKLRKFYTANSAGLRIRSHPTLQSEQVGIIKLNGIISFIDEVINDDGVWVRLSTESIRKHCTMGWYPTEAWCLQFNQHFSRTLLHPVESSESNIQNANDSNVRLVTKPKHKVLLENIDPQVSNSVALDTPKAKSTSPSKKIFDFSHTRFAATPKSADMMPAGSSTNPFLNASNDKTVEELEAVEFSGSFEATLDEQSTVLPSTANLGSAIAGVVEGGASKLQALQKWFKGDSVDAATMGMSKDVRKRADLNEKATSSVRELVRAMTGPELRSSPMQIPSSSKLPADSNSVSTNTSGLVSSNSSNSSRSFKEDCGPVEIAKAATDDFDVSTIRMTNFTAKQTAALLSTPKHTPRKLSTTQRAATCDSLSNNELTTLDDDMSVLQVTTSTQPTSKSKPEDILASESHTESSNVWPSNTQPTVNKRKPMGPIKRAMPPSLAESIRAVFAAFLWHEGLVHDAMASSSFLKFHPTLPKEGATVVTRREHADNKTQLSKEQKAQQRHSVEVANAGNYLNIRPSTLETLTKSGNSSLNNRKYRKSEAEPDKQKLHLLPEVVTVLPPALRCLVYLWEHVCTHCVQVVQTNSLDRREKEQTPLRDINAELAREKLGDLNERDTKKSRKKKKEEASWCEICELFLPIPVTYHMRLEHPGCGKPAKGKGYNSVGIFCEGWAGNCGEGGKGASSWYLMCDICREKYLSLNKNVSNFNDTSSVNNTTNEISLFGGKSTSLLANSEVYTTMRENATFLLELCSSHSHMPEGNANVPVKRSPHHMPIVMEHEYFSMNDLSSKPSTSRAENVRNSRIGNRSINAAKFAANRKSFVETDNFWSTPDTFAYLECMGALHNDDLPYEMFGYNNAESGLDRPLSEISYDSCDVHEMMTSSMSKAPPTQGMTPATLSKFHRSYSMGQGWHEQPPLQLPAPSVVYRRRNNSISETDGSLFICYPSENLRKLVPEHVLSTTVAYNKSPLNEATEEAKCANANILSSSELPAETLANNEHALDAESQLQLSLLLNRPAICFITQKHDLEKLRYAMKRSLRIATCRIYSLQALNWLLRCATQSVCLHDLMWWFVSCLSVSSVEMIDGKYEEHEPALEHPVSYTQISGHFSHLITQSLHVFLQSVADLTLHLPLGSPLQRAAIQCFGIRFRQADHKFLHSSHVFGNISKILSKSDEQNDALNLSTHDAEHYLQTGGAGARLLHLTDLNGMFEVTVSSRVAMAEALTDNSTETFWESDEEDRNKCKIIELSMTKYSYVCRSVLVHLDNSRDIQNKVINVVFYAGPSLGDTNLIKSVDVDQKACAWIAAKINDDSYTHFRLEFHGPENTLRVRQIKLLGLPRALSDFDVQLQEQEPQAVSAHKANLKLAYAWRIQQQLCESETLRVFRLITGQVFGKLISDNRQQMCGLEASDNSLLADSLDLREHMVGILFSRSKLSHLQKQVIVHIVHAIRREAQRAKEEWEVNIHNSCIKEAQTHTTSATSASGDIKSESSSERSRLPDTYCFEMLSMVLALSGSVVGRSYLSQQHGLLKDLLTLLHTGSDRVQRQVTALLRRMLPEITPESFAELLGVQRLPPTDYIAHQAAADFDMQRLGLLDILLAIIAKSLQLQIKTKTQSNKTAGAEKTAGILRLYHTLDLTVQTRRLVSNEQQTDTVGFAFSEPEEGMTADKDFICFGQSTLKSLGKDTKKNLNQRWFLNGTISVKQAESIISLIRDMIYGKLGEKWSQMTKAAIAEAVLNLTRLDMLFRAPEVCIKTATLWLALASLCVLDRDHVEKLSSGQWSKVSDTHPLCSNHDDGETPAIIQCESCGSLCGDCDRFLHLNRKTRSHKRTVCKEEEEAIRVELHESCGRIKLFWLLALADSKTLKAMVEFRDGSHTIISGPQESVGRCRFCGITGNSGLLEIGNVCADAQCQEHAANSCMKTKPCGHACGGVANEKKCLPCLQHVCHARENELAEECHTPKLTQDADDMCMICFTEALSCAPSVHLDCGHVFHYHCCKMVLEKRWNGPRIAFGFSLCPICKTDIGHPMLADILDPINALKEDVKRKALMRLKYEGLVKEPDARDAQQAMERYAYYVCFKCKKAYYGGEARCDAEVGEKFDPEELVCGGCSDVARAQMCPKHGMDFLEYKCRYCCSVAVYFCFGTTHFCDTCHDDFQRLTNIPKNKLPQCPAGPKAKQLVGDECPLHVMHPPTGEEFALGCGVCRNAQTF